MGKYKWKVSGTLFKNTNAYDRLISKTQKFFSSGQRLISGSRRYLNVLQNFINLYKFFLKIFQIINVNPFEVEPTNIIHKIYQSIIRYAEKIKSYFDIGNVHLFYLHEFQYPYYIPESKKFKTMTFNELWQQLYFHTVEDENDIERPLFDDNVLLGGIIIVLCDSEIPSFFDKLERFTRSSLFENIRDEILEIISQNKIFLANQKRLYVKSIERLEIKKSSFDYIKNKFIKNFCDFLYKESELQNIKEKIYRNLLYNNVIFKIEVFPQDNQLGGYYLIKFEINKEEREKIENFLNEDLTKNENLDLLIKEVEKTIKNLKFEEKIEFFSINEENLSITDTCFLKIYFSEFLLEEGKTTFSFPPSFNVFLSVIDGYKGFIDLKIDLSYREFDNQEVVYLSSQGLIYTDKTLMIEKGRGGISGLYGVALPENKKRAKISEIVGKPKNLKQFLEYSVGMYDVENVDSIPPDWKLISTLQFIPFLSLAYDIFSGLLERFKSIERNISDQLTDILEYILSQIESLEDILEYISEMIEEFKNFLSFYNIPGCYALYVESRGIQNLLNEILTAQNRPSIFNKKSLFAGIVMIGSSEVMRPLAKLFKIISSVYSEENKIEVDFEKELENLKQQLDSAEKEISQQEEEIENDFKEVKNALLEFNSLLNTEVKIRGKIKQKIEVFEKK